MKFVLVFAGIFVPHFDVKVYQIKFDDLAGEIVDIVIKMIKKFGLESKTDSYCINNANTDFRGVRRQGSINIHTHLQEDMSRKLLDSGH